MSSSTSSSSSPSRRQPLQPKNDSETNKQIRLIPYTPLDLEIEHSSSRASDPEVAGSDNSSHTTKGPTSGNSTPFGLGNFPGSASSSPLSPSSTATSLAWVRAKGVSGSRLTSSGTERSTPPTPGVIRTSQGSFIRRVNAPTHPVRDDGQTSNPNWTKPVVRREKIITLNPDKTFSLVLKTTNTRVSTGSESTVKSLPYSNTSVYSSHEETSFDAPTDDPRSSVFSSLNQPESGNNSPSSSHSPTTPLGLIEDPISASPWNYRLVGGLRKVPTNPSSKDKGKGKEIVTEPLPPLPETSSTPTQPGPSKLALKTSFTTEHSNSTIEETTNYKIIGRSSPILPGSDASDIVSSASSSSNYRVLGQSSAVQSNASSPVYGQGTTNYKVIGRSSPPLPDSDISEAPISSRSSCSNYELIGPSSAEQSYASSPTRARAVLDTPGSKNYIIHGSPYNLSEPPFLDTPGSKNFILHRNASQSSSVCPTPRVPLSETSDDSFGHAKEKYSQESLVVPPLHPHKRSSSENLHVKHTPTRSHHGRSYSFSSISSILTQDTGPNVVLLARTPSTSSSIRPGPWAALSGGALQKPRMDVHQWSSQLSTVLSEYEGSEGGSRLTSAGSGSIGSSGLGSHHSRYVQSISSSLLELPEPHRVVSHTTHSRSGSLDRPGTVFMRGARELPSPPVRMIRDHDEHGDGLADLNNPHQLQSKASWSRLGFLSRQSSDRSLRSTASTLSLTATSLPAWARFYYGSGEKPRWLTAPSIISEGDDYEPPSLLGPAGSPAPEESSQEIHNPRRRPRGDTIQSSNRQPRRDTLQSISSQPRRGTLQSINSQQPKEQPKEDQPSASRQSSLEIRTTGPGIADTRRVPRTKPSSVWSPHLDLDHRASHYSLWEPPSVTWSAEDDVFGRRNIQLLLFSLGFIFPFAWMIAAVLPLPPNPYGDIKDPEKGTTPSQTPENLEPKQSHQRVSAIEDARYQSARWWRNLNRYMSIVGLLILGAVAALIVVGIRQGWGK